MEYKPDHERRESIGRCTSRWCGGHVFARPALLCLFRSPPARRGFRPGGPGIARTRDQPAALHATVVHLGGFAGASRPFAGCGARHPDKDLVLTPDELAAGDLRFSVAAATGCAHLSRVGRLDSGPLTYNPDAFRTLKVMRDAATESCSDPSDKLRMANIAKFRAGPLRAGDRSRQR